jgi:hypothetical protein
MKGEVEGDGRMEEGRKRIRGILILVENQHQSGDSFLMNSPLNLV